MKMLYRYLTVFSLTAALAGSIGAVPSAAAQRAKVQVRVFDSSHKDYHNWDDKEDRTYRQYRQEQHKPYRPYAKTKRADQNQYWEWRHTH